MRVKVSSVLNGLIVIFILVLNGSNPCFSQNWDANDGIKKYNVLLQIINYAYVDSVNNAKLVEKAIVETLKELDPHSAYIPKKDVEKANENLVGNFEGIGIQFEILNDTINIVHTITGGPSEKLGIMPGDKIVRINKAVSKMIMDEKGVQFQLKQESGDTIAPPGWKTVNDQWEDATGKKVNNQYVLDRLRGKKGTRVSISIFRKGKKDLIDYTIVRDKIPINSIDCYYMIAPGIGYINLTRFSGTSMTEFHDALRKLKAEGLKNLILDLRNNSGGYMMTAVELADEFLSGEKLIVYTQGLRSQKEIYKSTGNGDLQHGKLVVMINENSASASEIVSGAIQDWDRGIILGRRSFGKGLVQRPFQLPDSSQIRLTTARYYTPSGRCIQMSYAEGADKYYESFRDRFKHGEMVSSDSIKFPDSLKYYTSQKRVVYGAGGIMPDVFIPLDTSAFTDYFIDLRRKNVVNRFIGDYVDQNRTTLKKEYPDFKTFDNKFVIEESFLKNLTDRATKEGVKMDEKGYGLAKELIKNQIKALVAEKLWDINALYEVLNEFDKEVQKAVKVVNDDALFSKLKIQH
ncbi:MAG: S41 family peptidase [Bacteroidetes bacterium]|nr:S41 family peptidase [Bacteroidota bacterium]